jgi:uncharacterized protein YkwD
MDAGTTRRWTLAVVMAGTTISLVGATGAQAAPRILSTDFNRGAVAGRALELQLRATDSAAPVTGMVVGFGSREGGLGLSSCLPPDSAGRSPAVQGPVRLVAGHSYAKPGARSLAVNVTSGGCTANTTSTLQRMKATVVPRGATPSPLVVGLPQVLPPGAALPNLPGLGELPLPGGARLPAPTVMASTRQCPGSGQRFNGTPAGRVSAAVSLLCLLNAERRARGLRPVRANGRLSKAALGHSRAMVQRRFFGHVGPARQMDVVYRLRRAHYIPTRGGGWLVGENLGFGSGSGGSPLGMHRAWMHSTPHRHAMLLSRFREAGFGIHRGEPNGRHGVTYTVDFGTRR